MKRLFLTTLTAAAVAHCGAFFTVWDLPYVDQHLTYQDAGRKLNRVFKFKETHEMLRDKREAVRAENEALFVEPPRSGSGIINVGFQR